MKTYAPIQTQAVSAITCDCCKTSFTKNDQDWYEIQSIEFNAGYGSIFGDGNTVAIDLCQGCLKQTLGQWLRVSDHRLRKQYTLEELIANTPEQLLRLEGWDDMIPVGREFGADRVRFRRVLRRSISVFGNLLEAVQWLTADNAILGGQPMQFVVASEEECQRVLEVLSAMENES